MESYPNPIRNLIVELLDGRYEGVTFSDEIIENIEAKVAPAIRAQAEDTIVEFVADYFSPKKPTRKPRKPRAKKADPKPESEAEQTPTPEGAEPSTPTVASPTVAAPVPPASTPAPSPTTPSAPSAPTPPSL